MKKLLILLSAILLSVGCGSPPSSSPPAQPKLSGAAVNNGDGTATVSWATTDLAVTMIEVRSQSAEGMLLATDVNPFGSVIVPSNAAPYAVVALDPVYRTTIIFLSLSGPPAPGGLVEITISWANPTTYSDGTPIEQDNVALLLTEIYWNKTGAFSNPPVSTELLATSLPGASSVIIQNVYIIWGDTYYFSARCHISPDGLWSDLSLSVSHSWPLP